MSSTRKFCCFGRRKEKPPQLPSATYYQAPVGAPYTVHHQQAPAYQPQAPVGVPYTYQQQAPAQAQWAQPAPVQPPEKQYEIKNGRYVEVGQEYEPLKALCNHPAHRRYENVERDWGTQRNPNLVSFP